MAHEIVVPCQRRLIAVAEDAGEIIDFGQCELDMHQRQQTGDGLDVVGRERQDGPVAGEQRKRRVRVADLVVAARPPVAATRSRSARSRWRDRGARRSASPARSRIWCAPRRRSSTAGWRDASRYASRATVARPDGPTVRRPARRTGPPARAATADPRGRRQAPGVRHIGLGCRQRIGRRQDREARDQRLRPTGGRVEIARGPMQLRQRRARRMRMTIATGTASTTARRDTGRCRARCGEARSTIRRPRRRLPHRLPP